MAAAATGTELEGVRVLGEEIAAGERILTPDALEFVVGLHRRFNDRRLELLKERNERRLRLEGGETPDFPAETAGVRAGDWKVAPTPPDLQDRRVEITGPVDAKMV